MNLRNKKITLFLLTLATIIPVAFLIGYSNNFNVGVRSVSQCDLVNHVGYHYQKVEATADSSGHEEFYSCCICHQSWLENPGGSFSEGSETLMTGGVGKEHVAYIEKKKLLKLEFDYYHYEGGLCEGEGLYEYGETVTLKANVDNNQTFVGWFLADVKMGAYTDFLSFEETFSFQIEKDMTIRPVCTNYCDTTYSLHADGYYLEKISPRITELEIPSEYKGQPVVGINVCGDTSFSVLDELIIPSSVLKIEGLSPSLFPNLNKIIVDPDNPIYDSRENCNAIIETATNKLIKGCNSTVIPDSVETIGEFSFFLSSLASITIPASVISINTQAFSMCFDLVEINFEEKSNLKTLANSTFVWCSSLASITIPASVTYIDSYFIYPPHALTSVIVDPDNPIYDSRENCNAIIETATNKLIKGSNCTVIPNSVTSIGNSAFIKCITLETIVIPDSVREIGSQAFDDCRSLTNVSLPYGVNKIGNNSFQNCTSLKTLFIPDSVTEIGLDVFYNCSLLTIYCENSSKPDGWNSHWNYSNIPVVWGYTPE